MNYYQWFHRITESDTEGWESDITNLAKVSKAGVSIPPGFVVSKSVFYEYFGKGSTSSALAKLFKGISTKRPALFAGVSKEARSLILKGSFSPEIREVEKAYFSEIGTRLLRGKDKEIQVKLIGCGEAQVSLSASVKTVADFEKALRGLYSLAFTEGDLFERSSDAKSLIPEAFSVIVQFFPEPAFSGEAACHDPETLDDTIIQIKAWPSVTPRANPISSEDLFRVDRKTLQLLSRSIQKQAWAESVAGKFLSTSHLERTATHLTDERAIQLARMIKQAQSQFPNSIRFNWAYSCNQFLITQARQNINSFIPAAPVGEAPFLRGIPGNFGQIVGSARHLVTKTDWKKIEPGDVVIAEHLSLKDKKALKDVSALVTEAGTSISPESKLAKELLIPAVVGTGQALSAIKNGQVITVDGSNGIVHQGTVSEFSASRSPLPVIGTKLYTTVFDPYQISKEDLQEGDGVGLLRGEFIIRLLGVHPKDLLRRNLATEYKDVLAEGIDRVLQAVSPRPVVYQLHDLTSMDLLGLRSRQQDRHEPNPTLGYRGAHRLLSEPEVLDLELDALRMLARKGKTNFQVMVPMARTLKEVERMLDYLHSSPLATELDIKMWVKCETPGLLIQMDELCELGIAGVCFDVPSLAQFIQGIDKENRQVAHTIDSADSASLQALHFAIATCREAGIPTSIVAEMEELSPEVIQTAIQAGVTAISVSPSETIPTRGLVAAIEQRMLLDHLIDED